MDIRIEKKKGLRALFTKRGIPYLAGAVLLIFVVWLLVRGNSSRLRIDARTISVGEVARGEFNDYIRVTGQVQPITTVQLSPLEAGVVERLVVEEGASVHKGDVLVELSNTSLTLEILNSEAELAEKQNILRNTLISMEQQKLDLRLDKGTTVTTSGALSPNSAYCVYGYGMRNDGTVTSNLVRKSFRTLSNETPQIAITLGTIESTSVEASFAPQDGDIEYAALLRPAAAYLELGDEECLKKLVEELVKEGIDGTSLLKGDATRTFDMLTPDTEYLLFAFGYDAESQQAFTSLSRKVFKSAREFSELTVEITVEDITPETAQVAFIPSDKNATYFYSVEPAHQFEGLTDEEFIARAVANAKASGLLSFYLTSGDEAYRQDLYPDMDYVAFAFGFEYGSMQVTTGLFRNEFRSGHLDVPELGIDIKVSNLTSDTATVTFTPTNDEAYYFSYVAPSAEFAGLDDDAMIEKALSLPGYALAFVDCGTLDFDAELSPGTEYTAIAFGYEHDMPTTKPFTLTFTSPEWEDPSQLFKISHSNLTSDSADIHVIPADKQMRYFSDLKLSSDYEGLTEEEITRKMIDEAWYISLYIHYGILDEPFSGLQADTEYTYFIFGYDSDTGTRTTPVTSYRIRTAAQ